MALTINLTYDPILPDGMELKAIETVTIPLTGKGAQYNKDVTTVDGTFSLASITTIGCVKIKNRAQQVVVVPPAAPVVTPQGAAGVVTWTYKLVAIQSDGTTSAVGVAGSTAVGNAALNSTDFNQLTWDAVTGADHYDIYRTVAGGTPSTTGKIGSTTLNQFNDTGLAGDGTTAPIVASDNLILLGADGITYPLSLFGQEIFMGRWNAAVIHHKANTRTVPVDITLLDA